MTKKIVINTFRFLLSAMCAAGLVAHAQSPALASTGANASVTSTTNAGSKFGGLSTLFSEQPAVALGQSATQLPSGHWLLMGGRGTDGNVLTDAAVFNPTSRQSSKLTTHLALARSGHTATLMPDGSVLILGGVDAGGNVLATPEQFDPVTQQFRKLDDLGLIARSGHTATVLADGRLLIIGGTGLRERAIFEAELYNPFSHRSERFNAKLDAARLNHLAALLPSQSVLLWGGINSAAHPLGNGEVFDPASERFTPVAVEAAEALAKTLVNNGPVGIKDSQPAADDQAAPVDRALVVRFNQRMQVASLDISSVTLIGPHGAVPVKVVPVESGLLLFVTPLQDLLPASRYTLFINGGRSQSDQALPFSAIGFSTAQLGTDRSKNTLSAQGNAGEQVRENRAMTNNAFANDSPSSRNSASTSTAITPALAAPTSPDAPAKNREGAHKRHDPHEQKMIDSAEAINQTEEWHPDERHHHGDWRIKRGESPLQSLPPLQALAGETALAGQVLTLHGRALAGASLSVGDQSVQADETGRFLIRNLKPGTMTLTIDGQTATRGNEHYGFYQVRVDIKAAQTNVLDYTIWSTKLDPSGSVQLPSPTTSEIVVTSPRIPGLELRIPAGTVIRDRNGKIVTEINMTAIPVDRPPFPLPNLGVPVYFTIQPGGATLTNTSGRAMQGAQLIYPNFSHAAAGSRIDFWNYDIATKGWYVYGQGTVSKDGKQVMPDAGVAIYEFTGAMISAPGNAPPEGPPPGSCGGGGSAGGSDSCSSDANQPASPPACAGDPVDCATGLFLQSGTDLFVQDVIPLRVTRSYRPRDTRSRAFGIGTNLSYDYFLIGDTSPWTYQDLVLPDGGRIHYVRTSPGTSYGDAVYKHTSTPTKYFGSTIRHGSGSCYWQLDLKDGAQICFPESYLSANARAAAPNTISDRNGNTLTLTRGSNSNLTRVTSPSGRFLQFIYDANNRITQASDNIGRTVTYQYDASGRLSKVTDPAGQSETYTYDTAHNMLSVQDKRGNLMVTNVYDASNRVSQQTYADGTTNLFAYTLGTDGKVTQTDITNELGVITRMVFNASGYSTSITKAVGLPEQQIVTIERDPVTNLMLSRTDATGRKTTYTYDANGNQLTQTSLAGTADAITATMTYTAGNSKLSSLKDVLGRTTAWRYDGQGNLVQTQDANGNIVKRAVNGAGQLTQITDALGKSTTFTYDGFDLTQVTDALNRSSSMVIDSVGRVRGIKDALGNRTLSSVDALDRVTTVTDPLNQVTTFGFDANSNLAQVQDAKGNLHQFDLDQRNAVTGKTDPLLQSEAITYDAHHNIASTTDRNGQVTQYAYDALDRLISVTYDDASTLAITYDQADRPVQFDDSVGGTITRSYDNFDRVTQETTPKGSVAYTYYTNGLRKSMTVSGQPALTYTYDAGNRLVGIVQAAGDANNNTAQSIVFTYDANNRRTKTSYTNGITRNATYDAAGQLTGIVYRQADGTPIGDLAYAYDPAGRRIKTSGSLARIALPADMTDTTVDAANRLTAIGAQALSYDANGDLINDGNQIYVWNARNQLAQITDSLGTVISTFDYDALGRRQSKSVNGVPVGFVYDGLNVAQELTDVNVDNSAPANVKANYISSGIDEVFAQLSGTGASAQITTYLTDALGSVIRLTDGAGNKVVDYTYDPYGVTTADAVVDNPFQYTGRENDGNGLYYYRARYYSPQLQRFISNDPIGLAGGINSYAYVEGNPISYIDPRGLDIWIEGPSKNEPSFHQSVNVGNPNGSYNSYSYGMNGNGLEGEVYRDVDLGGQIEVYKKTTPQQDDVFRKAMELQVGNKGIYGYDDICRSWSQRQYNNTPGVPSTAPPRMSTPHWNVSPSSSRSTTGTSSTTGTGTSR